MCVVVTADMVSYTPPELFSVTGAGALDADTFGGQTVNLLGFGFGPLSSLRGSFTLDPLLLVTYGPVSVGDVDAVGYFFT
jgi:hypothetical protein